MAKTGNLILDHAIDCVIDGAERVLVIADFEGTLFPYGHKTGYDDDTRRCIGALDYLAGLGVVSAVVGDRDSFLLREMAGSPGLVYGGHAGKEVITPWGVSFVHPAMEDLVEPLKKIGQECEFVAKMNPNMHFENRTYSLMFRGQVPIHWLSNLPLPGGTEIATRQDGHLIQPRLRWDKGDFVDWLMGQVGAGKKSLVIYFGDDDTDVPAWSIVRKQKYGIGVCIGDAQDTQCVAQYKMQNHARIWPLLMAFYTFMKKVMANRHAAKSKRAVA